MIGRQAKVLAKVVAIPLFLSSVVLTTNPQAQENNAASLREANTLTPTPDRILLTWNGDPATTQAVTWRTSTVVAKAVGQIAHSEPGPGFDPNKKGGEPAKLVSVEATTDLLVSDLGEAHYHNVTFRGLSPKTQYVYRVGDGSNWSEWFQFRTASDQPEPLRFIYFGDVQNDIKSHGSRVIREAFSDMPRAHFLLYAGDLIDRANSDEQWGAWHEAGGWIHGMVPSIPTPGNHEYEKGKLSGHWRHTFALPENGPEGLEESVYFLDVQGVRVISLNSNERLQEQAVWLEPLLANNPNAWTIITFHHPIYSTAKGRDNVALRDAWRPLFDQYAPDLVLQGHDHTYGRSGPMKEDNLVSGVRVQSDSGTVYVVSVSGPKMYRLEGAEWMQSSAENLQLYQLITIEGNTLRYEARTADGALYDAFHRIKHGSQPSTELTVPTKPVQRTEQLDRRNRISPWWFGIGAFAGGMGLAMGWAIGRYSYSAARRRKGEDAD